MVTNVQAHRYRVKSQDLKLRSNSGTQKVPQLIAPAYNKSNNQPPGMRQNIFEFDTTYYCKGVWNYLIILSALETMIVKEIDNIQDNK